MMMKIKSSYYVEMGLLLCALVSLVLIWWISGIEIDSGLGKLWYDFSLNICAASILSFMVELALACSDARREVVRKHDHLVQLKMITANLIERFVYHYAELTSADVRTVVERIKSLPKLLLTDRLEMLPEEVAFREMTNMMSRSICTSCSLNRSVVEEYVMTTKVLRSLFISAMLNDRLYDKALIGAIGDFISASNRFDIDESLLDFARTNLKEEGKKLGQQMVDWLRDGTVDQFYVDHIVRGRTMDGNLMQTVVLFRQRLQQERRALLDFQRALDTALCV